ncbi:MAG: universal stress protein, partial [Chloroflexi bacterium]|nr:universal stress protein [Chloroflexota bacterium]
MSNKLPTFETIVVPVDGSELSESAVPIASAIATPSGARVNLVTVALTYQVPVTSQLDTVTRQSITRLHAEL